MGCSADLLKERDDAVFDELGRQLREARQGRRAAAKEAHAALVRLAAACKHHSGQSYDLRAMLYSLWNGEARSVRNCVTGLDWQLQRDGDADVPALWDAAIQVAFEQAGEWDWFLQEALNNDL